MSHMRPFEEEFKRVFDHPVSGREASKRLLHSVKASAALQISPLSFGPSRQEADGTMRR